MKYEHYFKHCIETKSSFLCTGIDPDPERLPDGFSRDVQGIYEFVHEIIQITADLTPAYKFNLAFFELWGWKGLRILEKLLSEVPKNILLLADAKRGDIGNSSKFYARALLRNCPFTQPQSARTWVQTAFGPSLKMKTKGRLCSV